MNSVNNNGPLESPQQTYKRKDRPSSPISPGSHSPSPRKIRKIVRQASKIPRCLFADSSIPKIKVEQSISAERAFNNNWLKETSTKWDNLISSPHCTTAKLVNKGPSIHEGEQILIQEGEELKLKVLGKGSTHKAWKVEGKEELIIKTWIALNPQQKMISIKEALEAYEALNERAKLGDIQVAQLYNQKTVKENQFFVYKYYSGPIPTYNDIKEIIKRMIMDPSTFIADFRPENLRMEEGKIVVIDPYIEVTDEIEEKAINLVSVIKSWFMDKDKFTKEEMLLNKNICVNKKALMDAIQEFDNLELEDEAKEIWDKASKDLKALILS